MKLSWIGWALNSIKNVLRRDRKEKKTHQKHRDKAHVKTKQRLELCKPQPKTARNYHQLEELRKNSPLGPLEGVGIIDTLISDFKSPNCKTIHFCYFKKFLHLKLRCVKLIFKTSWPKSSTLGICSPVCSTIRCDYIWNHRNSWVYLTSWMNQARVPCGHFTWIELDVSRNLVPDEQII